MSFKFNPTTGKLDLVGSSGAGQNFSHKKIDNGLTVVIPVNQQMIIDGGIKIHGQLTIGGSLKMLPDKQSELSVKNINRQLIIPLNEQMVIKGKIKIRARIFIRGSLVLLCGNINRQLIIPSNEQLVIKGKIKIRARTFIRGSLALICGEKINYLDGSALPPYFIESGKIITVPEKKVYNIFRLSKIRGSIINRGLIVAR